MHLSRRIIIQFFIAATASVLALVLLLIPVVELPSRWFGIGRYTVTAELPRAASLYERANVTYRGYTVGRVNEVRLTDTGVEAVMSLDSDIKIPSDLKAEAHVVSAIGEPYIDLLPQSADAKPLQDGDVIAADRTSVPPEISSLLNAANRGLEAIPRDNLKTVVDEAYLAVGGLGPELNRLVKGTTALATDARANLNELTGLIDQSKPVLDTQIDTSDSLQAWAANLATVTDQLRTEDPALRSVLKDGPPALGEASALFDRLQPTLPVALANLVPVVETAAVYRGNLEGLLVALPQGAAAIQGVGLANRNTKQDYIGGFLSFNLNINLPPPCTTGFLPIQQQRSAALEDYPPPPEGDMYCRIPQDAPYNVRGARNTPCVTRPGKRAPTVKICESDEYYMPLNDGYNWKGDPNATLSGQEVPQPRDPEAPGSGLPEAPPPPIAAAEYDPASGSYVGADGKVYTESDLDPGAPGQTWQSMLLPPGT
jgi:phospholipid/cholesterol/gamma-HCH transport system substrate-binding protein